MLRLVEETLSDLGLVAAGRPLRYCINITTGESISVSAFVDDGSFFQIKSSEHVDLQPEFLAYRKAWEDFPLFVPKPLGFMVRSNWRLKVSEGVEHTALPAHEILNYDARGKGLASALLHFFELGCAKAAPPDTAKLCALREHIEDHFATTRYAALVDRCLTQHWRHIETLPQVAQHGDFVLNNIARSGRRLIIFDWEDYGRITLHGLDLATLLFSVCGGNNSLFQAMCRDGGPLPPSLADFLRRACAHCKVDVVQFRQLLPAYLMVFLYMKRNYGVGIQQRIGDVLENLSSPQSAMRS
jgi:hypothetical protein